MTLEDLDGPLQWRAHAVGWDFLDAGPHLVGLVLGDVVYTEVLQLDRVVLLLVDVRAELEQQLRDAPVVVLARDVQERVLCLVLDLAARKSVIRFEVVLRLSLHVHFEVLKLLFSGLQCD